MNDVPIASRDDVSTLEDTPLSISALLNDTDTDSSLDPATLTVTKMPKNGTATVKPDGTIQYMPNPNFNGHDTLIYRICDNGTPALCDTSLVVITINPVNDPPIANRNDDITNEDTPVTVAILGNDSDTDASIDPSSVVLTENPKHGTVVVNANGSLTYIPNPNFSGKDTLVYRVCDNGSPLPVQCDTALVVITVNPINDPPIANWNADETAKNKAKTVSVLTNDSDIDGFIVPSTVTITEQPKHGIATANADGTILYTPASNYVGHDTLVYRVCDNGIPSLCDTAVVFINITPACTDNIISKDIREYLEQKHIDCVIELIPNNHTNALKTVQENFTELKNIIYPT